MSLTSAMLVGFTGINSNTVAVDTVGNNLANLNTTGFKGQRTLFQTLFYETLSEGQAPLGDRGGTLPRQTGYGVSVASLQRDFGQGALDSTGIQSDLAVANGNGFFVLQGSGSDQTYTRDGSFSLDETQTLVSANGARVQVFGADAAGNIAAGRLTDLVIPLGSIGPAVATTAVILDGRLDSATGIASVGAVTVSDALMTASGAATAATPLTQLIDESGTTLFATGDEVVISASKGGIATPTSTFLVGTTGSTLGDLATHLDAVLGIATGPNEAGTPGVTVSDGSEFAAGALVIRSNTGNLNAVELNAGSIVNRTGSVASPLSFTQVSESLGGGVTTSFGVFDSLGNSVDVRLRLVLESKSPTGTTWRFHAESVDDSDASPLLGTGTVSFDANGQFVSATNTALTIDAEDSGATSPLSLSLDFTGVTGLASPDGTSEVMMASQNGTAAGEMTGYSIDADGIVTASFSNQQTRVLGQIALATFPNREGLVALGENRFAIGPNTGDVTIRAPRTAGAGSVISGALEQSNVDLAREFINLISASTGISSASRVVRVADDLLQELLLIAR
ncbi:MAG: flagellar hook-basal body complex protein [Planctomycetes bacterium]|nr:flagellar hook-basal body complex protein [Planctomycetota bacterium]